MTMRRRRRLHVDVLCALAYIIIVCIYKCVVVVGWLWVVKTSIISKTTQNLRGAHTAHFSIYVLVYMYTKVKRNRTYIVYGFPLAVIIYFLYMCLFVYFCLSTYILRCYILMYIKAHGRGLKLNVFAIFKHAIHNCRLLLTFLCLRLASYYILFVVVG